MLAGAIAHVLLLALFMKSFGRTRGPSSHVCSDHYLGWHGLAFRFGAFANTLPHRRPLPVDIIREHSGGKTRHSPGVPPSRDTGHKAFLMPCVTRAYETTSFATTFRAPIISLE